jgi:hypothetical protein
LAEGPLGVGRKVNTTLFPPTKYLRTTFEAMSFFPLISNIIVLIKSCLGFIVRIIQWLMKLEKPTSCHVSQPD